jgi:hypothetical protein
VFVVQERDEVVERFLEVNIVFPECVVGVDQQMLMRPMQS